LGKTIENLEEAGVIKIIRKEHEEKEEREEMKVRKRLRLILNIHCLL